LSDRGPFDRILDRPPSGPRDKSANVILLAMAVVGLIIFILVVSPLSLFGGGGGGGDGDGFGSNPGSNTTGSSSAQGRAPNVPEGFEALSRRFDDLQEPRNAEGPYVLTVNLLQPVSDARNLGLYTYRSGRWERLTSATLVNNGTAATGEVGDMPRNVAVLRPTVSAVQISGWLVGGMQPDATALSSISIANPIDHAPSGDGSVSGTARSLPPGEYKIVPTVRASSPEQDQAVNAILASPALRQEHISALVQLALAPGNAGVNIDYPRVNAARKADFTAFITTLSDQMRQANRTLTVTLPPPIKAGVSWDSGAYDWEQLGRRADMLNLIPELDPSIYYQRMGEILEFLRSKVDMKKVSLVVARQSFEKASDGLRGMTLHDALALATEIEVRTAAQITPNSAVVIVGKNLFQDDGASGLRWDERAFAVSFEYPGRGGQRTVWLENKLSIAFKLDLARRYGMGGVAISDISANSSAAAIWEPVRTFGESGNISLVAPNSTLLRPTWQVQAGSSQAEAKGNVVWTAPAQPGAYDVSLIVSDGVIRASQKVVLEVRAATSVRP
jgi:hypothetical protein